MIILLFFRFKISKIQAADIIKHKDIILKRWQSGDNLDQKTNKIKGFAAQIDKNCFDWFVRASSIFRYQGR
nr:unnamed protein product [Callosobruchus analis]